MIEEETTLSYKSKHSGKMHACGHDGHMAMLLGFAEELDSIDETMCENNVLLVFQPSEETVGGAKPICDTGIFDKMNTKVIVGFHVYPFLKKSQIGSRPRELMARVSEVEIKVIGKSTHCAQYASGIDPIEMASDLLLRLYKMEKSEISKEEYRLLRFGLFHGGTVQNIIPEHVTLKGSIRSFNDNVFDFIVRRVKEIIVEIEKQYQGSIEFNYSDGYPMLLNDESLYGDIKESLSNNMDFIEMKEPLMIAEDFSFYCNKMPGCFMFLGTGTNIALHNCKFDFDEEILDTGINAYLKIMNFDLDKYSILKG